MSAGVRILFILGHFQNGGVFLGSGVLGLEIYFRGKYMPRSGRLVITRLSEYILLQERKSNKSTQIAIRSAYRPEK
ncbi:hypothetical protein BJX64DRAFT_218668 [Aspergillus heterothallicus]